MKQWIALLAAQRSGSNEWVYFMMPQDMGAGEVRESVEMIMITHNIPRALVAVLPCDTPMPDWLHSSVNWSGI